MRGMVERFPANAAARFGLATELLKAGNDQEAAEHLRAYLGMHDDEGNAWGRLAEALRRLGDTAGAREALTRGIQAADRHGHPGMSAEFEMQLDELDD